MVPNTLVRFELTTPSVSKTQAQLPYFAWLCLIISKIWHFGIPPSKIVTLQHLLLKLPKSWAFKLYLEISLMKLRSPVPCVKLVWKKHNFQYLTYCFSYNWQEFRTLWNIFCMKIMSLNSFTMLVDLDKSKILIRK